MRLYPYESLTIRTPLSPEEIKKVIGECTGPKKWWSFHGGEKYFEGKITDNGFSIQRSISHRNSFIPQIHGRIEAEINGSRLRVKMTLHPVVLVFMIIWMSFAAIAGLKSLSEILSSTDFQPSRLIPFGLLLAGWVLVSVGFWPEAGKAKKELHRILKGNSEQGA